VFLGRLDPIKRPWVFVEIARRMPDVDFILMGKAHFAPPGAWVPEDLPPNVRWEGHIDGAAKQHAVSSAWALVNTSIHESLPVSFIEAFAAGTPVISTQDPGRLVTRFGTFVGRFDGDGLDSVPAFIDAIRRMPPERSLSLGAAARSWATATHTPGCFESALLGLCAELRVRS
jgi:glycosyltransferase involved in cell wall biosynthesis